MLIALCSTTLYRTQTTQNPIQAPKITVVDQIWLSTKRLFGHEVLYRKIKHSFWEVSDLRSSVNCVHPSVIKASFTDIYLPVNTWAKVPA